MVPFEPDYYPDLLTKHILLSEGLNDPIVSKQEAERLFTMLKKFGAKVTLGWQDSGHDLSDADIRLAKEWLSSNFLNT
jgi:phospholipase/carboxylesterase